MIAFTFQLRTWPWQQRLLIRSLYDPLRSFHFNESQRKILRTRYQNGVTSTSQAEKITEIAAEIGATSEQVKVKFVWDFGIGSLLLLYGV